MRRWLRGWACAAVLACGASVPAAGQDTLAGRVETGAGIAWVGRTSFGSTHANLVDAGGGTVPLFTATSALEGTPGLEVHAGWRVAGPVQVEVLGTFARPRLETAVTADVEGPAATAAETITQFTVVGQAVIHPARWRLGARLRPFVSGGAGYLRELHDGRTLVEAGRLVQAGGGVFIPIAGPRSGRFVKGLLLRIDARAVMRGDGVDPGDGIRVTPVVTARLVVRF